MLYKNLATAGFFFGLWLKFGQFIADDSSVFGRAVYSKCLITDRV